MTDTDTSHDCRAADHCRGYTRDRDTDERLPATTEKPNTLCEACIRAVVSAVQELRADSSALGALFLDPSARSDNSRRASTPVPPIPVNVFTDALMHKIDETVDRCAQVITDQLHTPMTGDVYACVENNVDTLLLVPPHEAMEWNRAGDDWDHTVYDGPGLALELLDLHRRARATLGVDRGRDRMPVPCPRCEHDQLGRWHGSTTVNCLACGSSWTEDDYKRLTLFVAEDLKATERPKPRDVHLHRWYQFDPEAMKRRRQ